ncbi:caspase family protein [Methyloceanibacter sp.]|uniref:caspase family protein n=1 Tax=Methyloceanibacter sp. TaxID=1965321 RepID=UPI003D6D3B62
MRRSILTLPILIFAVLFWMPPAFADKRVALVVGNSAYQSVAPLVNAANDATDMAAALKSLGFEVIEGHDLNQTEMVASIRRFSEALLGADTGLFFYAGHGLQVGGTNYLVPIDAKLTRENDLPFEAVTLDLVLAQLEREAPTAIVFLDACRDNPMAQTLARSMGTRSLSIGRGLARIDSGVGTFIAFSTQPGNVALDGQGRNSPFTSALLKHVGESGKDLSAIMIAVRNEVYAETDGKQVPWDSSSLRSQFFFSPSEANATATQPNLKTAPVAKIDPAAAAWAAAKDTSDISVLEAFISRYADSFYAELARARIADLKKQKEQTKLANIAPREPAILPPNERLALVTVSNAPGDGQASLRDALKKRLNAVGIKLASAPGKNVYTIRASAKLSENGGRETVQLDWEVVDPTGKKLGSISQQNSVPKGSLDGPWGAIATAAAGAASDGIIRIFLATPSQ